MPYDLKRIPRQAEPACADAARIGEELRDARLALGLSIEQLAVRLRIRRVHLEALEEGRLRDLPGPAYAVGFVRTYAAALGLDGEELGRRFRELTGAAATKPKLVFPEPIPERGMPAGAVIALGAVIAIGAYVAWFNWSGGGERHADAVPPVPARLEQAAEQGRAQLPGRETPQARQSDAGALPLAALPPPGGLPLTPPPASQGANTAAQAATMPAPPVPEAPAPAATPVVAATTPAAPVSPPAFPGVPDGTRIILRARPGSVDGAWIQVRDPRSGQVLVNRVLRPNEFWAVPQREGLMLDTGKADGLEILVDAQPQPTLDGLIGVRRNIALEPDRLRQRLAPTTASASQAAAPRN